MPSQRVTTLRALCERANTPFVEVTLGDNYPPATPVVERMLDIQILLHIRHAHVYFGLLQDVHIFWYSFIYTRGDEWVFNGQMCVNYNDELFDAAARTLMESPQWKPFDRYIEEEGIFIGGLSGRPNFGHFVFEYLTRLAIFDSYGLLGKLPIFVHEDMPDSWLDFMEILGIPRHLLVKIPVNGCPAFRKVWVSSVPNGTDDKKQVFAWKAGYHWLRHKMLAGIGGAKVSARRRLYLGRQGVKWRKVINEAKVIKCLEGYGFECPLFEHMPARQQIELISGAELVVATEGAGATLTHFAPEHCVTLLLSQRKSGGLWGGMAAAMFFGQIYEWVHCTACASSEHLGQMRG